MGCNLYLGGQAVGEAGAELLYGLENPSGKLAETYPISYQDCSSARTFGVNPRQVEYAESIYVGYRYYEKAGIPVQFPFGYGLSYTQFELSGLRLSAETLNLRGENTLTVSCTVKNTGSLMGAEVVQVYISDLGADVFKAQKELRGFRKVRLAPGEEREITVTLDHRAFAHYDAERRSWEVRTGRYTIALGVSSADIRLYGEIDVLGTVTSLREPAAWYLHPTGKPSIADFEKIYGQEIQPYRVEKPGEYTLLNTFNDLRDNPVVQQIMEGMKAGILQGCGGDEANPEFLFTISIVFNTPLIRLVQQGGGATPLAMMEAAVECANGDQAAAVRLAAMMGAQ